MRISALVKRISQQMLRDRRTLGLLFVAPMLILTLMYFLFNGNAVEPKLGVLNVNKSVVQALENIDVEVKLYENISGQSVVEDDLDGLLVMSNDQFELTIQNDDPATSKGLQMKVKQVLAAQAQEKILKQIAMPVSSIQNELDVKYVYGSSDTDFFDILSPILVGFFVFFFVFLIAGIGLLRERTTGTLERLMSTPIRRSEVVVGYLIGYGIFAVIQTILVVLYAVNILDIALVGSIWNVILINLLLAIVALSLGILLSTFAATEFQMMQFIPIAIIPQIFFAGILPTEGMADWLQAVGKVMPLYYGADALKGVMYKGYGFSEISGDIYVLLLFAAIFIVLNTLALKKYRKL